MSLPAEQREQVRQRAERACEYCGVSETDAAGMLTVDHFHPQARGGSDDLGNLVYCCHACNGFKSDYWPQEPDAPLLWNPRRKPVGTHFVETTDGRLAAVTECGRFTLKRLRLNRLPLVENRQRRIQRQEEQRLLTRLRDITTILEQLQAQHNALLEENRSLLQEQGRLLRLLINQQKAGQ